MKIHIKIFSNTLLVVLLGSILACSDMDATYREFLESGEITYPGKADSVKAYSGDYRVKLTWLLLADPTVVRSKVFWNNRKDSVDVNYTRTTGVDTISTILANLEERAYTFEIYNYDLQNNVSVKAEVLGTVYGDNYRNALLNRVIRNLSYGDGGLHIQWEMAEETSLGVNITFQDSEGQTKTVFVPSEESVSVLEDIDIDQSISYQTLFLPDTTAIDTFKAVSEIIELEIIETLVDVDRSGFSLKSLPGDENAANSATNSIDKLWTNPYDINATPFISKAWAITACNDLVPFPYWFTIDMGAPFNLTSFTLFQRSNSGKDLYAASNLKKFEIWGALEVDEQYNPKDYDGVFDHNWVLLKQCELIPPEDAGTWLAEASKGHEFDVRKNGKPQKVRYLRIKAIDNWQPETGSCPLVKKRTYINIASFKLNAIQQVVKMK